MPRLGQCGVVLVLCVLCGSLCIFQCFCCNFSQCFWQFTAKARTSIPAALSHQIDERGRRCAVCATASFFVCRVDSTRGPTVVSALRAAVYWLAVNRNRTNAALRDNSSITLEIMTAMPVTELRDLVTDEDARAFFAIDDAEPRARAAISNASPQPPCLVGFGKHKKLTHAQALAIADSYTGFVALQFRTGPTSPAMQRYAEFLGPELLERAHAARLDGWKWSTDAMPVPSKAAFAAAAAAAAKWTACKARRPVTAECQGPQKRFKPS